jgi:uncharacterized membrane protein
MGWCGCAVPREGDRVAADPPPDHAIRGSVSLPGSTAATASTSNMRGDLEGIECVLTLGTGFGFALFRTGTSHRIWNSVSIPFGSVTVPNRRVTDPLAGQAHAATTTSRHVCMADALKARCVPAEVR